MTLEEIRAETPRLDQLFDFKLKKKGQKVQV